jgi:hypothetical protein
VPWNWAKFIEGYCAWGRYSTDRTQPNRKRTQTGPSAFALGRSEFPRADPERMQNEPRANAKRTQNERLKQTHIFTSGPSKRSRVCYCVMELSIIFWWIDWITESWNVSKRAVNQRIIFKIIQVAFDNYRFIFFGFLYSLRIHININFGETFHWLIHLHVVENKNKTTIN